MGDKLKSFLFVVVSSVVLLFLVEGVSSIIFYQKYRAQRPILSSIASANRLLSKVIPGYDSADHSKLDLLVSMRQNGQRAYPNYLFAPQLHTMPRFYALANPVNSRILNCNESGFWSTWDTDEVGFRNPKDQIGKPVDFIFIGDSFAEGWCENEENTIPGYFRGEGKTVFNLGRGGSGPLFQLATLREYGGAVKSAAVVWIVFTGNDLANLREEKTTILYNYLQDENYSQDHYMNRSLVSEELSSFLDKQIRLDQARVENRVPYPYAQAYGETLDYLEAREKEIGLLYTVADKINRAAALRGQQLHIVIIDHPFSSSLTLDTALRDLTSETIKKFARDKNIPYLEFDRSSLEGKTDWYNPIRMHFNAVGNRQVAMRIFDWLNHVEQGSM